MARAIGQGRDGSITGLTMFGLTCAAAGAILYSSFQGTADRAKQHILYRNNPAAEYSFPDPFGLVVDQRLSPEGRIETYLQHTPSRKEYLIRQDMVPDTEVMLKSLHKRIYKMPKDEQRMTLRELGDLTAELSRL